MRLARLTVLPALIVYCASLDFDGSYATRVEYGPAWIPASGGSRLAPALPSA
jgi:hypothetical protein